MQNHPDTLPARRQESVVLMDLIQKATTDDNFSVEKLSQLLDVKERWDAEEARKAFVVARTAFKRSPPHVVKDKSVDFKNVHYRYATLGQVAPAIDESLAGHGLSYSWSVSQVEDWITVTCTLTHELGHFESVSITAPPDNSSDSKNVIQRIGSAVSYLQRYTLLSITGLAATDQDDDGRGAGTGPQARSPDDYPKEASNYSREASNGQRPSTGVAAPPAPAKGARCSTHDKLWGKHPETGLPAHPDGPGNWCLLGTAPAPAEADSTESQTGFSIILDRLASRMRVEQVPWPAFLSFLGVEMWDEFEARYGGEGITDREREKVATTAAWKIYEEDKRYRSSGCKKCSGEADVLGQLWCASCSEADRVEREQQQGGTPAVEPSEGKYEDELLDAAGNVIHSPLASDPEGFETADDPFLEDDGSELRF